MSENIMVVHEFDVLDKAYQMGYNELEGSEAVEDPLVALSHYKEGAHYINNIASALRCMSGFRDTKGGTFQDKPDQIVLIPGGSEDDRPIDGDLMDPHYVMEKVQESFDNGALDALEDRSYGASDTASIL